LFFASTGDEDGHRVLGSTWASESDAIRFLIVTIASAWEWLAEVTGEGDAEITVRVILAVAVQRGGPGDSDEGRDAEEE
jgi:hypothetical protein